MRNKFIKATIVVSALSVITRGLSFFFRIYLSNTLGAEDLGIYQIALSVFFLFATLTAGLPLVVSRKTAEYTALGIDRENSTISATLVISFAVSSLTVVLFLLFPNLFHPLFSDERCIPIFTILLPASISTSVYGIIRSWFWGKKNYTVFALTEFFECSIRILLGLLLISGITGVISGIQGTALSFTISDYLCTAIIFIIFLRFGGRVKRPSGFRSIVHSAVPLTAVRVYNSLINSLVAIIVPAMLIRNGIPNSTALADYGRAMGMAMPLILAPSTLTGSIATVLVPELATLKARKNDLALKNKVSSSLTLVVLCTALFVALFLPLGDLLGDFLYGDVDAGKYVSFASIIVIPMGINGITSTILDSIGKEMKTMKNYVVGSISLLASLVFLPRYIGTYSIAVGFGASYTVTGILNCKVIKRELDLSFSRIVKIILSELITIGVCAYGGFFMKNLLRYFPLVVQIIIPALFITIFYVVINSLYGYVDFATFYKKSGIKGQKNNSLLL